MNAEIICVGTELLLGDTVNTNAADIGRELAHLGINVYHQAVVGDNAGRLKECVEEALSRSDIILLSGGLGPTYDDLTKETVAACFGRALKMDESCLKTLESYFVKWGRPMTENNRKQAMMPEGGIVLENPNGTAPGCVIEREDGKAAILMPGPPREMRPMMAGPVRDYLLRRCQSDGLLVSRVVNMFGAGESVVEDRLKDLMLHSSNPTVAPYAKQAELQLRVTARAATEEEGYRLIGPVISRILEEFPENVYGFDFANIQQAAVRQLVERELTLAVAESCTGGLVAARLVESPGASKALLCGVVAYADEIKERVLGVPEEILRGRGAVSRECALAMARGARRVSGADIGLSTTGVAGPDGGTSEKPVGLVYVAAVSDAGEEIRELRLARGRADDRENIRYMASSHALDMAMRMARRAKD